MTLTMPQLYRPRLVLCQMCRTKKPATEYRWEARICDPCVLVPRPRAPRDDS